MSKRIRYKRRVDRKKSLPSSSRKTAEQLYRAKVRLADDGRDKETEIERIRFFVDYGFAPPEGANIIEYRKKYEEAVVREQKRVQQVHSDSGYISWQRNESPSSHTCTHHCYHTSPGSYGGSRSDTYDSTTCCHCGISAPNPYDNERR